LGSALLFESAAAALLAAVAFLRLRRPAFSASAFAALLCAGAAAVQTAGLLYTVPLEVLHAPLLLAEELKAAAGPSEGRWRIRGASDSLSVLGNFGLRVGLTLAAAQGLDPQYHTLAGVESASGYGVVNDRDYDIALSSAPSAAAALLGVRFDVRAQRSMSEERARKYGYRSASFGSWVKQFPERPRAFLATCARSFPALPDALHWLASPRFRVEEAVLRQDLQLPCPGQAKGEVKVSRPSAARMLVRTEAAAPTLLVVAEHYDLGWHATVDGKPAAVMQVDLAALGVVVAAGEHEVALHFVPHLLGLGLVLCGGCVLALLLLELAQRDDRVGAAEAERV
jgi:hypothetical protein